MTLEIKVGQFYWLAGQGPMKLEQLPGPYTFKSYAYRTGFKTEVRQGTSYKFRNHAGGAYWASREQILRETSEAESLEFVERLRERSIVSPDFVPCWDPQE